MANEESQSKNIPTKLIQEEYLNEKQKEELLKLARKTAELYLKSGEKPEKKYFDEKITSNCGVFVTLNKNNTLRGCIGYIAPIKQLYKAVIENTINALVNDYRFPKVTLSELDGIEIEISVLTPPREIGSYKDIILGKHGIILQKDGRQAVFLPQVAVEQKWDLETTLTHLSMKAGLSGNDWKNANYAVFSAQVFHEER